MATKEFFKPKTKHTGHASEAFISHEVKNKVQEQQPVETQSSRREREPKSRRLNLLVRPSVYEALIAKADEQDLSFNALCNRIFSEYLEGK